MKLKANVLRKLKSTPLGERLVNDRHYRTVVTAVLGLIFNLLFAFYNGILGLMSHSLIFVTSAVYYFLLTTMRFSAVALERKSTPKSERQASTAIGIMLIVLSWIFQIMVIVSMKYAAATPHGTIPMITIATYTFTKITTASISAAKHRKKNSVIIKAINSIRYSEIAVSILTMQQSMLVSFGDGSDASSVIFNACTGAAVCFFVLALGIITLKNRRKES